jgi:hypothetical protein
LEQEAIFIERHAAELGSTATADANQKRSQSETIREMLKNGSSAEK